MDYSAIIVAAGKSTRFGANTNKLLWKLSDGQAVLNKTLTLFRNDTDCKQIVIVTNTETIVAISQHPNKKEVYCQGGETRCHSVYQGLKAANQKKVLVHDGARCYLLKEDLDQIKKELETEQAVILVKNETDTIKLVQNGYITATIDRDSLKHALTPQGFDTELLLQAYRKAMRRNYYPTDDAGVMEKFGEVEIRCLKAIGSDEKITTLEDIK